MKRLPEKRAIGTAREKSDWNGKKKERLERQEKRAIGTAKGMCVYQQKMRTIREEF